MLIYTCKRSFGLVCENRCLDRHNPITPAFARTRSGPCPTRSRRRNPQWKRRLNFFSKILYIKKPHHRVRRDQTRFFWIHFLIKVNSSRGRLVHHLDELLDVDAVLWIMVQHRECQAYHQSIQ